MFIGNFYLGINLKAGTDLSNDEGQYIVKATWEFQELLSKDISECSNLDVDTLPTNSNMQLLTSTDVQPVSFTAADKPVVTVEPAVKPETN